jgi:heme a synthase
MTAQPASETSRGLVSPSQKQRFLGLALITIAAVYFLILVGGTVRASGAGMGCPDWPLCFGQFIPPTSEAQLPPDWRVTYADRGYDTADFDPVKTWTEYINRLVGVVIGLLVIATAVAAWPYRRADAAVFWSATGALFFVGLNGWIGSQVVASNLRPVMISLHMLLAFFVQMFLIYAAVRAWAPSLGGGPVNNRSQQLPSWFKTLVLWTLVALTVQIFLGIQIRESVDLISRFATDLSRDEWIDAVPWIFYVHRSFSWVILGLCGWLLWRVYQSPLRHSSAGPALQVLVGLVVFEMLLGAALNYLGFPLIAQPVHLLAAHLIFGLLWFLWALLKVTQQQGSTAAPTPRSPSVVSPLSS